MVVAQLVELFLMASEIYSSNPVIGNIIHCHTVLISCIEKTNVKKKRTGMAQVLV